MSLLIAAFVWPAFLLLLAAGTVGEVAVAMLREWTGPPKLPKGIEALRPLALLANAQALLDYTPKEDEPSRMRYDHEENR